MVLLDQAGRGRSEVRITTPAARVAHFVEHSWVDRCASGDAASHAWRIVPDAAPHLIYHVLRGPRACPRLVLVGARSMHIDIDRSDRVCTAGLRFRAGALRTLFGVSGADLADRATPLQDVMGAAARELLERLASEPPAGLAAVLEGFAAERVARAATKRVTCSRSLCHALESGRAARVGKMAEALGVGGRALRLRMREYVGLSPKRVARVARLHRALSRAVRDRRPCWTRIAAEAGFADQSHMIREFVALVGEPPEVFLRRGRAA